MKDSASSGIEGFLPFQGPSFQVLAGSANFLFRAMLGGSPGGTVSLANSFPKLALQLFGYGRARDEANGIPLQDRISRINAAISGTHGVAGVKAAMTLAGFHGGIPRRPLLPLTTRTGRGVEECPHSGGTPPVSGDILAIDVGTTALKIGVFSADLEKRFLAQRRYAPHVYDHGKADIEPEVWWEALRECCADASAYLAERGRRVPLRHDPGTHADGARRPGARAGSPVP